jgi:hypothetical protein
MSTPAVRCTGLVKRFGDVTAVDGLFYCFRIDQ